MAHTNNLSHILGFFLKHEFQEYKLRTSADCDRQRRVICQQSPLSYLDVETELLLITDGRSNDPRDFGISIEEMKDLYSKTEINVSYKLPSNYVDIIT